jgi:hypothetical protein
MRDEIAEVDRANSGLGAAAGAEAPIDLGVVAMVVGTTSRASSCGDLSAVAMGEAVVKCLNPIGSGGG